MIHNTWLSNISWMPGGCGLGSVAEALEVWGVLAWALGLVPGCWARVQSSSCSPSKVWFVFGSLFQGRTVPRYKALDQDLPCIINKALAIILSFLLIICVPATCRVSDSSPTSLKDARFCVKSKQRRTTRKSSWRSHCFQKALFSVGRPNSFLWT